MNRDDLIIVKRLINEVSTTKELTKDENNLLERINTILDFDEVQAKFNEDTKAFNEKMKALSEKAGE